MRRFDVQHHDLVLSYLDSGADLPVLIALHAHWMEGATFLSLAAALGSGWRVIALDQRGHGYSSHAATYTLEDYLSDLDALFDHLHIEQAVLLGNSLGGVNSYSYAASRPERVRALIVEDIGVELSPDMPPILEWSGTFSTRAELEVRVGPRFVPYLRDSFRQTPTGWKLAFEPRDMLLSQASIAGDHWSDWLASSCPALVIRGSDSRVTTAKHVAEMTARRPNTIMVTLNGGHIIHNDDPVAFAEIVRSFLKGSEAI